MDMDTDMDMDIDRRKKGRFHGGQAGRQREMEIDSSRLWREVKSIHPTNQCSSSSSFTLDHVGCPFPLHALLLPQTSFVGNRAEAQYAGWPPVEYKSSLAP